MRSSLIRAFVKYLRRSSNIRDAGFLFPFVFWVSLSITVLVRQLLWVFSLPSSYNHNLVRVSYKMLFPLPASDQNGSQPSIFVQNIQIPPSGSIQNKSKTVYLSQLTRIDMIGTLERGLLAKIIPYFILREAQIVSFSTKPTGVQRITYPLSRRLRLLADSFAFSLSSSLPSNESALAAGLLLGGNQRFSFQFRDNIRAAGLLHLTAVSGYNIAILIGSAIVMFKLLGNRLLIIPGVIISIIFFTLIAGGSGSVIRAALMGTVGFLALQFGSTRSTQRIFVLTALLMLIIKPAWLWDVGWELSIAATASLIWFQPVIYKYIRHPELLPRHPERGARLAESAKRVSDESKDPAPPWRGDTNILIARFARAESAPSGLDSSEDLRMTERENRNDERGNDEQKPKNVFLESLSASLSAYLATFPLLVYHFGWDNISWVGIFTNLLAQPLVPLIMASGTAVGFTGMIWPAGAQFLAILTRPPIWALVKIIEIGAKINQLIIN